MSALTFPAFYFLHIEPSETGGLTGLDAPSVPRRRILHCDRPGTQHSGRAVPGLLGKASQEQSAAETAASWRRGAVSMGEIHRLPCLQHSCPQAEAYSGMLQRGAGKGPAGGRRLAHLRRRLRTPMTGFFMSDGEPAPEIVASTEGRRCGRARPPFPSSGSDVFSHTVAESNASRPMPRACPVPGSVLRTRRQPLLQSGSLRLFRPPSNAAVGTVITASGRPRPSKRSIRAGSRASAAVDDRAFLADVGHSS